MMLGKKNKLVRGLCSVSGDIVHHGHIEFIRACRKQCDYLIVAVPTDECIKAYKGRKPIMNFDERMKVVKEIKGVEHGINLKTFDWKYLLRLLAPDIVFDSVEHKGKRKGADVYIPYTEGISSTIIKERIIEAAQS